MKCTQYKRLSNQNFSLEESQRQKRKNSESIIMRELLAESTFYMMTSPTLIKLHG